MFSIEVFSIECPECGGEMQPRFINEDHYAWWCLSCGHFESASDAKDRALFESEYGE